MKVLYSFFSLLCRIVFFVCPLSQCDIVPLLKSLKAVATGFEILSLLFAIVVFNLHLHFSAYRKALILSDLVHTAHYDRGELNSI